MPYLAADWLRRDFESRGDGARSAVRAVGYTLDMMPKLRRCFDYAEVELSNNLAEKLDAARGAGAQELAARRQRQGWNEGRRDALGH